jgi:1,4-dihydroxy-2-naphthoate octaprenyltransferase
LHYQIKKRNKKKYFFFLTKKIYIYCVQSLSQHKKMWITVVVFIYFVIKLIQQYMKNANNNEYIWDYYDINEGFY